MRQKTTALAFVFLLTLLFVRPACAYIDPGTGSYLLQILLAGLFGLLYTLKMYWAHVRGFFRHRFGGKPRGKKWER